MKWIADGPARRIAVVALLLAALPLAAALFLASGRLYLGSVVNLDDHMVYAAWATQAVQGRFLFDNRFAVDPQPGLTIHLYFLLVGWLGKVVGVPLAANVARLVFSALALGLIWRWAADEDRSRSRWSFAGAVFGGGLGFLVWHDFGQEIVRANAPAWFAAISRGRLPVDVWQPEAFVLPSLATNGLFAVSLVFILLTLWGVLQSEGSRRWVLPGFLAFAALMNVHSYDVLIVAATLLTFAGAMLLRGRFTGAWLGRAAVICAGPLIPAAWFVHVLRQDAVFQARAATPTYSPDFRSLLLGVLPLVLLGAGGAFSRVRREPRAFAAWGVLFALTVAGFFLMPPARDGYALSLPVWTVLFLVVAASAALSAPEEPRRAMVWGWAWVGLILPYFPALFERKLAMGLALPWGLIAGEAVYGLLRTGTPVTGRALAALASVVAGATGLMWLARDVRLLQANVSTTTMHPVYAEEDLEKILGELPRGGRTVVLAMPGVASPGREKDTFLTPYLPDFNPILAGLTGVYAYAGHWSETPDYDARRAEATKAFLARTSPEERGAILARIAPDVIIAPLPEAFPELPLTAPEALGRVEWRGKRFARVRP